ncbi:Radical SAM superfamily enzyme, MoaA/NifB/PqqE/SkfB family [Rhizobiales bacterium GAS113]|nr:Radical SAM superfamily enzyme, MoaA/NifB/PqqE/SkfB family [Rhizobiales bacterium GAS113]
MESIYYVLSFACHRKCRHCYEDKFRPYGRADLERLVTEAKRAFPRVIANLPDHMRYLDLERRLSGGGLAERLGRIIVSGGEVLIDPVREEILYPALEALRSKYAQTGGVRLVVQTTGDLVTEKIIEELLSRGVWMISIAGMDDFHVGMEGERREPLRAQLVSWFEAAGMTASGFKAGMRRWHEEEGPVYSFFGATPDAWIGKLWPRGRAWMNGLSTATLEDNFCNRWSGGLNFLNHRYSGSEVAIEPTGDVYPCCLKTKHPLGNLTEERLTDILDSLADQPAFQAINLGQPERMGLTHGWSVDRFLQRCETRTPHGETYRNLCIGCDAFHEEVLGPLIEDLRAQRLGRRGDAVQ